MLNGDARFYHHAPPSFKLIPCVCSISQGCQKAPQIKISFVGLCTHGIDEVYNMLSCIALLTIELLEVGLWFCKVNIVSISGLATT